MLLLALLLACTDYAKLCAENDPSVDAATCWREGQKSGSIDGYDDAYDLAYAAGEEACDSGW